MFVKKDDTSSSLLTPADKKTETPKQYISTQSWDLDYPSATNHKSCPLWMGDEQMMKCHFLWCISPYCPLLNSLPPAPAASPSSPFQSLLYHHHHHISSGLSLPIFVVLNCCWWAAFSCIDSFGTIWSVLLHDTREGGHGPSEKANYAPIEALMELSCYLKRQQHWNYL